MAFLVFRIIAWLCPLARQNISARLVRGRHGTAIRFTVLTAGTNSTHGTNKKTFCPDNAAVAGS